MEVYVKMFQGAVMAASVSHKRKVKRLLELVVIPWLEANVIWKDGEDIRIMRELEAEK